ncbi:MAG TPA: DUF2213 domain-containing protein [Bryobacteraceae bacterium]|jgi:hypothetical protein|nr:DUF2213 domain-containing protein [Bryobacteraceae bacterium]
MRFYTTDQLGPNRHLTPEGFLVCKDVAIGRTGDMVYAPGEVPVEAGPDGLIRITRDADAVFHDDTIASFQGKPITLDHPPVDVTPRNWCSLAKGVVQHVRRGEGTSDSLLLADLLITDQATIDAVRDGLRQVSCGYDAEYEQLKPGYGRQRNIIGNHVALVEKGRCGERCAIRDGDKSMSAKAKKTRWTDFKSRITAAFKARDEGELQTLLTEAPEPDDPTKGEAREEDSNGNSSENGLAAKVDAIVARLDALEARLGATVDRKAKDERKESENEEDEDDDEDEKDEKKRKKSEDSASTRDQAPSASEIQDIFARAEILAPGIKLPTMDQAAKPAAVRDSLCALRRLALTRFVEGERGRKVVLPFFGGKDPDFKTMTCDAVQGVFVAASEIAKRENNYEAALSKDAIAQTRATTSAIVEINKRNKEFWSRS